MLWIYLHNLKVEMENDNEASKMIAMMRAQEEVLEEERKEASILSQMQKVQANLQALHSRLRSLEETVTGKSAMEPLADILPVSTDAESNEDASAPADSTDDSSFLATIKSTAYQWWKDEDMQEKMDAWYKYLWEDDEIDNLFNLDAWKVKLLAWWNGEEPPIKLHANTLLQTVEQWANVDGSLSWLRNKDIVHAKLEEIARAAHDERRSAQEKDAAAKKEEEIKRQRKIQAKLEKLNQGQSGIEARTNVVNTARIQKDFTSYGKN
ncbi:hypothetical protein DYB32_008007 [Aphanomyces invadans]|uniref:Uncharacterized protein n=1 Tax=Aphanomyces invadans TaxID=157072 RepID=A0A3R6Y3W7_9STRA|nr:hypothetical protein DYB32_008007 [Aphanomyces invadans]